MFGSQLRFLAGLFNPFSVSAAVESIPQKLPQTVASGLFARVCFGLRRPIAADKFKILAIVGEMFLCHRIGAPLPTLMGHARIVVSAIQAYFQVRTATMAALASSRLARQGIFPAATMTMSSHTLEDIDGQWHGNGGFPGL